MTESAVDPLELGAIKTALLERVRTPLGALEAHALAPFEHLEEARQRVDAIRQGRLLLAEQAPPPVSGAQDVRALLTLGEKGVMLEGPALRAIAETMRAGSYVRRHLLGYEAKAPLLYGMAASLPDLTRVADSVARCFDADGQLADEASADLGTLRRRVRGLRDAIRDQIGALLASPELQPYLQESYFTLRADRYVLPIKASHKNEVKGIVHDASGSGQTVFIEPQAVVDLGNRLKIAQSEQTEEEHRILSMLTLRVVDEADATREMMRVIGLLDLITACAVLADDLGAVPIMPTAKAGFDLREARHPLLLLQARGDDRPAQRVVANHLGLEPGQQVLVLTGPNTGGKTVAMKTVGLLALMARAGLHLPCGERSTVGWFDRIEVAIGDQQSIASHLSTFAAHLQMLVETLGRAGDRTLVLIDEIAADTDPTQGQALAQAILEDLAAHGAHVVVTTHFERLKAVPFSDARFRNAGVGFDAERLRPTYEVTLDLPQSSSGFDIAQGLGLPPGIVARAREISGAGGEALEGLMQELRRRSSALERAREQAEAVEGEAALEKQRLIAQQRELARERDELRRAAREELLGEIEAARAEVRRMIGQLQAVAEDVAAREAMRSAQETAAALAGMQAAEEERLRRLAPEPRANAPLGEVRPGDWVQVKHLGKDGEVLSIEGRDAHVAVGTLRTRVPLSSLYPARGKRPKREAPERGRARREGPTSKAVRAGGGPAQAEELDLRGFAADEALDRLDAFLDHHYNTPTTQVRVVHGHGTGALRTAIRAHLKGSGYVRAVRPGEDHEGGDGATVVELA